VKKGLESGIGFPTGVPMGYWIDLELSTVLQQGDVLKIDFGVQVNGTILDSAFTLTWEHTYDKLVEAVQAATETDVRVCGYVFGIVSCS